MLDEETENSLKTYLQTDEAKDLMMFEQIRLEIRKPKCPSCSLELQKRLDWKDEKVIFYECSKCKQVFSFKKIEEAEKIENYKGVCGNCAFYKTPKCTFENMAGYIKKKDGACADFFPDRHIERKKLRRKVQKRVE